ncbi:MAG: hypothetical protein WCF84_07340 [Anaerolineae bacterium]
MQQPPAHNPSASSPPHVRRILRRHGPFMVAAAAGLAGLYAEEAWAANQFWGPAAPANNAWPLGVLLFLVTLAGNVLAFILPSRLVKPERFPRPVGAFASAMGLGLGIVIGVNGLALLLLLLLVAFNLEASSILLKDVYVYTLLSVLFHALLYYVRQMHWLYDEFGGADSPLKPITASGGLGAILFILIVVFLPLDLQSIQAAPAQLHAFVSLHIYVRDLYLITLALGGYLWHLRWIADH